ncbi:MAG TPA: hypothetical protein VFW27_09005 [Actinoplanes sp.]|nr:hypothetical protein [Actinoplanes sp.]
MRLILAMVGGVMALLCLGVAGVVVSLYDEATEIKRTAPDAVVDSFLRAYLSDRDDKEAALYTCRSGGDLAALSGLRVEMINREKNFDVKVSVGWSSLTVTDAGRGKKDVSTSLTISGSSDGNTVSRRTESWSFGVVDEDGWRVCSAGRAA